jgi:hypothetical protein
MIRFGNSSSSGGTGDIKSNGSVNFVAAETWLDAGGNFVTVDPVTPSISLGDPVNSAFISPTQIVVAGASSNVILDNSGAVVITDATGITSEYRVIKISLTAAQIKTLNSVPVVAIPAVANRTVEIIIQTNSRGNTIFNTNDFK